MLISITANWQQIPTSCRHVFQHLGNMVLRLQMSVLAVVLLASYICTTQGFVNSHLSLYSNARVTQQYRIICCESARVASVANISSNICTGLILPSPPTCLQQDNCSLHGDDVNHKDPPDAGLLHQSCKGSPYHDVRRWYKMQQRRSRSSEPLAPGWTQVHPTCIHTLQVVPMVHPISTI